MSALRVLVLVLLLPSLVMAADAPDRPRMSGWEAFSELTRGNLRFTEGKQRNPLYTPDQLQQLTEEHRPLAVVLTCADSRVVPSVIFDLGLGDLYTIRSPGLVIDQAVRGGVEFAVSHLKVPLLVVLGSEHCHAVQHALRGDSSADSVDLRALSDAVRHQASPKGWSTRNIKLATQDLVTYNIAEIVESSEIVRKAVREKKLLIAFASYSMKAGKVSFWKVGQPRIFGEG